MGKTICLYQSYRDSAKCSIFLNSTSLKSVVNRKKENKKKLSFINYHFYLSGIPSTLDRYIWTNFVRVWFLVWIILSAICSKNQRVVNQSLGRCFPCNYFRYWHCINTVRHKKRRKKRSILITTLLFQARRTLPAR